MGEVSLMNVASLLLSLLSAGHSIAAMFGGGGQTLDIARLLDKLKSDITHVFHQELADQAVITAGAVAQASADWLSTEYRNAVLNSESRDQLWRLLDESSDSPGLHALKAQAGIMAGWTSDTPTAVGQQTASLALTIYGLIVAIFRERSANAPDANTRAAEAANMRDYARKGVERVLPLYRAVRAARFSGISPATHLWFDTRFEFNWWVVRDTWVGDPPPVAPPRFGFSDGSILFCAQGFPLPVLLPDGPEPPAETQISQVRAAYIRLLETGSSEASAALTSALSAPRSAFTGGAPQGCTAPTSKQLIAQQLRGFETTGKWLTSAPAALQDLRKIAGTWDYEVAYQGVTGSLCTFGRDPWNDWGLGMAAATMPGIVARPDGGYFISFSAGGTLYHAGTSGNGGDFVHVADATAPVAVMLNDRHIRVHYQAPTGNLCAATVVTDPHGLIDYKDYDLGMMPGTSPAAALQADGRMIIAFVANTGKLWTAGARLGPTDSTVSPGTNPAVVALSDGSFVIAWVSGDRGRLYSFDGRRLTDWEVQVAPATSPDIAASPNGGFRIAFQGRDGVLRTAGPEGITFTGEKMRPGTSPAVCALEISGYQIAFVDPTGQIVVTGDSGRLASGRPAYPGASPAIAGVAVKP